MKKWSNFSCADKKYWIRWNTKILSIKYRHSFYICMYFFNRVSAAFLTLALDITRYFSLIFCIHLNIVVIVLPWLLFLLLLQLVGQMQIPTFWLEKLESWAYCVDEYLIYVIPDREVLFKFSLHPYINCVHLIYRRNRISFLRQYLTIISVESP